MTDDLEILRPEVREAMVRLGNYLHITIDGKHFRSEDYDTIRAELLRLAEDAAMFAHAVSLGQRYKQRAETAEAELAALKARIAEAPEYRCEADIISGRDGDYISAVLIHDDNAFQYPDVDGKRVRLLVEE